MLLGDLHPATGKNILLFPVEFGDLTVLKIQSHAIRHVAVADNARCNYYWRIRITDCCALQLLTEHHSHTRVRDLVQTVHEKKCSSIRDTVQNNSSHYLRFVREEFGFL